jgi:Asp-tRNA(Asn)/Glu-tRNA(Gln) amidotransferase A subunit family amidase
MALTAFAKSVSWPEQSLRDAAAHLRDGDVSAEAYAQALLDECDAGAPLNAFIALDRDRVLREARAADLVRMRGHLLGPLHGIPLAIKDVFDVAGSPTTAGTPTLRDHVPRRTAPLVQTLFDAGASMLGKTNMHELAFGITSANEFTGAVRNPCDPTRSPGGSSGGTAAAVAARMAPAGLGSDTSGSIRIPAAHCGIVGFRPSTGRYARDGMVPMCHTRDAPGLMARHVDDIALIDQIITRGYPLPQAGLKGMRIGLPRDYFFAALDSRVAAAVETELDRLTALGVVFVEAAPPDFAEARAEAAGPIMAWEMPRDLSRYLATAGSRLTFADVVAATASPYVKSELEGLLTAIPELNARYRRALFEVLPRHRAEYEAYLRDNNLRAIVFPTTPLPPPPLGENDTIEVSGARVSIWHNLRNAIPATLLGSPSLSIPVAAADGGWPVGLEFDGWSGRDRDLLAVGLAWEQTVPAFRGKADHNGHSVNVRG